MTEERRSNPRKRITGWYIAGIFCMGATIGVSLALTVPDSAGILRWVLLFAAVIMLILHIGSVNRALAETSAASDSHETDRQEVLDG